MVDDSFAQGLADELQLLKKNEEKTRKLLSKIILETLCKDFELESFDNKGLIQMVDQGIQDLLLLLKEKHEELQLL